MKATPGAGAFSPQRSTGSFTSTTASKSQLGFTLIELVMVMVIIGIVGAYALVRWQSGTATSRYQAERLAEDIRYIQSLAMGWGVSLKLDITGNSYQVSCVTDLDAAPCVDAGDVVTDPMNRESFSYTLEDGVTLTGTDTDFDNLGRPSDGGTLLNVSRSFVLSGGGSNWTVAVAPVTGFASVSGP